MAERPDDAREPRATAAGKKRTKPAVRPDEEPPEPVEDRVGEALPAVAGEGTPEPVQLEDEPRREGKGRSQRPPRRGACARGDAPAASGRRRSGATAARLDFRRSANPARRPGAERPTRRRAAVVAPGPAPRARASDPPSAAAWSGSEKSDVA